MKLLVIEDDQDILRALDKGLRKCGYAVDKAEDGELGLEMLEVNRYDLVILDLNLPGLDGMEVLRRLRLLDQETKVLILSARQTVEDKVYGLDEGANDYLVKPFHFAELQARVRALLSRRFSRDRSVLVLGELSMDTVSRRVAVGEEMLDLTAKEAAILEYLLVNQRRPVRAEELLEHIWDSDTDYFSNAIKVHISTLRKKLGDRCRINNIRGVGYQLERGKEDELL